VSDLFEFQGRVANIAESKGHQLGHWRAVASKAHQRTRLDARSVVASCKCGGTERCGLPMAILWCAPVLKVRRWRWHDNQN
jgi:hypothetical protein